MAVSVREGAISLTTLLKRLRSGSHKNATYGAFREVGRVIRTVQLLRYLTDAPLRRRVTAATGAVTFARARLIQAAAFLTWLAERGRVISECTQADLDGWFAQGFVVLPRRWVVERSLSWIMRARRHCRDHERLPQVSESLITWASFTLTTRRLTRKPARRSRRAPLAPAAMPTAA